jgi:hypothetical protein
LYLTDVGVEPPRASRWRTGTHIARFYHGTTSVLDGLRRLSKGIWNSTRVVVPEGLDWTALAWSFIPGLGHLKTERRNLGRILLWSWLGLLALTLLTLGTEWARYCLGGMVAVHTLAIVSLFGANLDYERLFMRAAFGMLAFIVLHVFLYEPGVWFCSRFCVAVPVGDIARGHALAPGDGLLCEGPWIRPASLSRGDVVAYRVEAMDEPGLVIRSGWGVDRVIGVPGDRVQRVNHVLLVNGEPVPEGRGPFARLTLFGDLDILLGHNEYAIFTALASHGVFNRPGPQYQLLPGTAQRLITVRSGVILGRVILRIRPWSRFGRIR